MGKCNLSRVICFLEQNFGSEALGVSAKVTYDSCSRSEVAILNKSKNWS